MWQYYDFSPLPRGAKRKHYGNSRPKEAMGTKQAIFINVYDIDKIKPIYVRPLMRAGLLPFHIGLEVYGKEYTFSPKGVGFRKPRSTPDAFKCTFRSSSLIGFTSKTEEVDSIAHSLKKKATNWRFIKGTYNFLFLNCNHFVKAFIEALDVEDVIPEENQVWYEASKVNRIIPPFLDPRHAWIKLRKKVTLGLM